VQALSAGHETITTIAEQRAATFDASDAADRLTLARSLSRQGLPARSYAMALDLHESALHRGDELATAETADCLAECCYMTAQYEQGVGFARIARALWQARKEPVRQAGSNSRLAVIMATIGEPEAVAEAEAALQLAEGTGDVLQTISALEANGLVLSLLQQPDRGLVFCKRAVALSRRTNQPHGLALIDLAEVGVSAALKAAAIQATRQTQAAHETNGLAAAVAKALELTREALALARSTGDGWLERLAINNIAEYSLHVGDTATAAQALPMFDHAAGEATDRCRIHHLSVRGRMLELQGRRQEAVVALLDCRRMAMAAGDLETATPCHLDLARIHASLGDFEAAYASHRAFHDLFVRQASEAAQRRARVFALHREAQELRLEAAEAQALAAGLAASNDILAREAERLTRTSLEDPLTGLPNRRALEMAFLELLATRSAFVLAMIDVDHFKLVNDRFSHSVGDAVLRRMADLLSNDARQTDLVVRYGGEEFVLLMRDADLAAAQHICERLRLLVQRHDWASLHPGLAVTVSVGLAAGPEAGSHADVLSLADRRLYAAKRTGRNRIVASAAAAGPEC